MIFINDLDEGILNKLFKFADDTKLVGEAGSNTEIESLRTDLMKLFDWSNKWQMKFNVEKCKVMHVGYKNAEVEYKLDGKALATVSEEKDLGVIISQDLKVSTQCGVAAKKGYQILGLINRTFACKTKSIILNLYKTLVRPHLDYCIQAWRPHYQKDIEVLEKVQRRATRMIVECKGFSYEDRLRMVELTTLETRRLRADLIEVYKMLTGKDNVNEDLFFERVYKTDGASCNAHATRGHSLKLCKRRFTQLLPNSSLGTELLKIGIAYQKIFFRNHA